MTTQKNTAMSAALERSGFKRDEITFANAVEMFKQSGGDYGRALDLLRAAYATPDEGQKKCVADGDRRASAPIRQPVEGGEATTRASKDQLPIASPPSPARDGAGHPARASQGQKTYAQPRREPVQPKPSRGITAIALTTDIIKKGILELRKTSDGRAWASVRWRELYGMRGDGNIAGLILQRVSPPKDDSAELITLMSNRLFGEIIDDAQKQIA